MVTGNRREAGAGVIEYAGLIVLAALILGALYATGMPAKIGTHTQAAICHVFAGAHCDDPASGHPTASGDHDGDGTGRGDDGKKHGHGKKTGGGKDSGDNDECHGFFGCAAHYAREYAGGVYSQFWDDAKDDVHAFADPWGTAKSIVGGIWDHDKEVYGRAKKRWEQGNYAGAIAGGVWDVWKTPYVMIYDSVITDDVKKDWENGDYLHAAGRAVANTAEWFIPGGDAGKAGKAAKGLHGAEKGAEDARKGTKKGTGNPHEHGGKESGKKRACGAPAVFRPSTAPRIVHAALTMGAPARAPAKRDEYCSPKPGTDAYDKRHHKLAEEDGRVTPGGEREATAIMDAERSGKVPGPVERSPKTRDPQGHEIDNGDYVDANGQKWDVKSFQDRYPPGTRHAGEPLKPKQRYSDEKAQRSIEREIDNGENVVLDTRGLDPDSKRSLENLVDQHPEWKGKVVLDP